MSTTETLGESKERLEAAGFRCYESSGTSDRWCDGKTHVERFGVRDWHSPSEPVEIRTGPCNHRPAPDSATLRSARIHELTADYVRLEPSPVTEDAVRFWYGPDCWVDISRSTFEHFRSAKPSRWSRVLRAFGRAQ